MYLKIFTSGNLSRISLIFSPFCPMMARWKRCSMIMSFVRSFSCWNHDILRDVQSRVARQLLHTQRTSHSEAEVPTDVFLLYWHAPESTLRITQTFTVYRNKVNCLRQNANVTCTLSDKAQPKEHSKDRMVNRALFIQFQICRTCHAWRKLQQLLLGLLHTLGVSLNTDQVTLLVIRWNADWHFVQFFYAVNYK